MIVNADFLANIRQTFKLNAYEAKVWTALLARGTATASELAEISDVPRSRTYDVIESLEKKGFIVSKMEKPMRFMAVKPTDVVERAKKNAKEEAEETVKKLNKLNGSEMLNELEMLYQQGIEVVNPHEMACSIKGRHNIYLHIGNMLKNAKSSVLIATSDKGFVRKAEMLKQTFEELSKKGVKVKIAVPVTKESADAVKELAEFVEIRNLKEMNARFCIVDNKEIVFTLMHDKDIHASYDTGIWADSPAFASAMAHMFELAWQEMEDYKKLLK